MKYMGSKRYMLNNGLGEVLGEQLPNAKRFIDPFSGSGGVVNYVAINKLFKGEILTGDLQKYSAILARAVIGRTKKVSVNLLKKKWIEATNKKIKKSELFKKSLALDEEYSKNTELWVEKSRRLCERSSRIGPIWNAYGGHYFSPKQAIIFDYLLKNIPKEFPYREVCHAAIIVAASRCAAAPGHTAQPFQPTKSASKFIKISWKLDPFKSCETALKEIAPMHAQKKGKAFVSDVNSLISKLKKGDLVLIDPPYSGVQYSRFYHVLETLARGKVGEVSGVGRYPKISERPQSEFSNPGQSLDALEKLLLELSKKRVTVIFTFPKGKTSNGLSGNKIIKYAEKYFDLDKSSRTHRHAIAGKFSTLGGNNKFNKHKHFKKSRVESRELVLVLKPKT